MDTARADSIELTQVAPSPGSRTFSVQEHGPEASMSSLLLSRHSGLDRPPSQHRSDDHYAGSHVDDLSSIICMCSSCFHRKAFWERQYNCLKNRPASYWDKRRAEHSYEEAQEPLFSCDSLLSYWAFEEPGIDTESTNSQAGTNLAIFFLFVAEANLSQAGNLNNVDIRARKDDTISIWVGRVVSTLQTVIPDGLQLWYISLL